MCIALLGTTDQKFILEIHNGICEELHVYQDFGEIIVFYEPEMNSPIYRRCKLNRNVSRHSRKRD